MRYIVIKKRGGSKTGPGDQFRGRKYVGPTDRSRQCHRIEALFVAVRNYWAGCRLINGASEGTKHWYLILRLEWSRISEKINGRASGIGYLRDCELDAYESTLKAFGVVLIQLDDITHTCMEPMLYDDLQDELEK